MCASLATLSSRPGSKTIWPRSWQRIESFGLKIGNMMQHDFRDAILGRPGAGNDIEKVQESIRVAGKAGIPAVEHNWYALRAMGGSGQQPGRGGSVLSAHDYDRSRNLPVLQDIGEHNAADLWKRYEQFLKAVYQWPRRLSCGSPCIRMTRRRRASAALIRFQAASMVCGACARP